MLLEKGPIYIMTNDTNGPEPRSGMKNPDVDVQEIEAAATSAGKFMYRATAVFGALTLAVLAASKLLKTREVDEAGDEPIESVEGVVES